MADLKWNSLVTATVAGRSLGEFQTFTGGDPTGTPTKLRSNGSGAWKQYAVQQDYSDAVITRVYENVRDHALVIWLRQFAGKGPGSVTVQERDADKNNFGASVTYSGMLVSPVSGDTDISSADPRMLTLTFQIVSVR